MAEHQGSGDMELVEVKAEDIMAERRSFYEGFTKASVWGIGATIALLVLMAIFLL
jgi:hypothetical protein